MRVRFTRMGGALAGVATTTALMMTQAACGSDDTGASGSGDPEAAVAVVASTDVWASVVIAVGGDQVAVEAIIDDPSADPHSYELTARDTATLTGADLVVANGGGYDEFTERALDAAGDDAPEVIDAFEAFEHLTEDADDHADEDADDEDGHTDEDGDEDEDGHAHEENEHVWYHLPTVAEVAEQVAGKLAELHPDAAATFEVNAEAFGEQLGQLHDRLDDLHEQHEGAEVAVTEPIAQYLLADAGLHDLTPEEFVEAIELETDPPAAAVAEIQRLVSAREIVVLVHNPQTETPVVADVVSRADAAQLPIVEMTETLPPEQDYLTWMTGQIEALATALDQ